MTRIVMSGAHGGLMRLCLVNRLDVDQLRDEPALAILELATDLGARTDREIRISP